MTRSEKHFVGHAFAGAFAMFVLLLEAAVSCRLYVRARS